MFNLNSKKVLITGGSRGIGAACVKYFCMAGALVAFTYHTNSAAATRLEKRFSKISRCKAYKVDIKNESEIINVVQTVIKDFGRIDILVNNAGIWKEAKISKMKLSAWEETMQTNLTSAFLFTQQAANYMKQKRYGKIINISSTAGQRGEAHYSHYAASKGGMISFTKSLASELGPFNINVNSVAPGWVLTDMSKSVLSNKKNLDEELKKIPLRRIATADDIAGPVLFLASDLSRHINGEVLNVNGGSVLVG
ncbi:MAG: 3-oxoacyl-ACP reductase FabG [Ignavibacterium sp.]|jgi:3-oxoacyl-[acyl-carrier protein] reductase|nr:3-oxoacyl-ACP reductase FabG [Ignavibacterium sp.]